MGMVAPPQRIASAFTVIFGNYGDVSRFAQERGVCRQWVYQEAAWVLATLAGTPWRQAIATLQQQVRQAQQRIAELECCLQQAVVLDRAKQSEVASVAQAIGVSLPEVHTLLEVLCPGQIASVARLRRWTINWTIFIRCVAVAKAYGNSKGVCAKLWSRPTTSRRN